MRARSKGLLALNYKQTPQPAGLPMDVAFFVPEATTH